MLGLRRRRVLEQGFQSLIVPGLQRGNPQFYNLTVVMKE